MHQYGVSHTRERVWILVNSPLGFGVKPQKANAFQILAYVQKSISEITYLVSKRAAFFINVIRIVSAGTPFFLGRKLARAEPAPNGDHTVCLVATGPREAKWA